MRNNARAHLDCESAGELRPFSGPGRRARRAGRHRSAAGPGAGWGGGARRASAAGGCGARIPGRQGLGTGPLGEARLGAGRPQRRRERAGPRTGCGTRSHRRAKRREFGREDRAPTRGSPSGSGLLTALRSRPDGTPHSVLG